MNINTLDTEVEYGNKTVSEEQLLFHPPSEDN